MTKAKTAGKLTGKAIAPAAAAPPVADFADFPDALSYINSLATTREGVEWDLRVYKVESAGRGVSEKQPFLFNVQLEDLPTLESVLADQFPGGGQFRVQVRADNQLVKHIKLDIAARPGWQPPRPAYLQAVTPEAAPAANGAGSMMESFFVRMAEIQERSAQQTRDLIAGIAAANKPTPAPTMMEQLQLFTQFQALIPKGAQENTFSLFEKGMEFAAKMYDARGGSEGGASWLDIIKEALTSPLIKDALAAMAIAAQQPINGAPGAADAPPAPQLAPGNPAAENAIDTLCRQAAAGVDPKFVAKQVADNMPAALMEELEAQEDVIGFLVERFPRVAQHRAWFSALVAEVWEEEQPTLQPSPTLSDPHAGQHAGQ